MLSLRSFLQPTSDRSAETTRPTATLLNAWLANRYASATYTSSKDLRVGDQHLLGISCAASKVTTVLIMVSKANSVTAWMQVIHRDGQVLGHIIVAAA